MREKLPTFRSAGVTCSLGTAAALPSRRRRTALPPHRATTTHIALPPHRIALPPVVPILLLHNPVVQRE